MRITRLELKGYSRLMLGSIDHITYTPESDLQIIVGTNGCGKSSLLAQLSPLPGSPQEFRKGGFKKIWIEHQGDTYYLESNFKSSAHHSFRRNDEELNPGGTGQVQKELALQVFKWTPALHDLLTGVERITRMGPTKRREWIMRLSAADYGYATKVFNSIYAKYRDSQGALKHLNARIATENTNMRALEACEGLEERVEVLRRDLSALLISIDGTLPKADQVDRERDRALEQIRAAAKLILAVDVSFFRNGPYESYREMQNALARGQQTLEQYQDDLRQATAEYAELDHQAAELGQVDDEIPDDLDARIAQAQRELASIEQGIQQFHAIPSPRQANEATLNIAGQIHQIFSTLPDNSDRIYTPAMGEQRMARVREQQSIIDKSTARLTAINHRRTVLNSLKESQCPECGHTWREGFTTQEIEQLDAWESEHHALITQAEVIIAEERHQLTYLDEVGGLYTQLRGLMNGYPVLAPLWNHIMENQLHLNRPNESVGLIQTWIRDCKLAEQRETAKTHLQQLTLMAQRQADGTLNHITYRRKQLTTIIETTTASIQTQRQEVGQLEQQLNRFNTFLSQFRQLEKDYRQFEVLVRNTYGAHANRVLEERVHQHQDEMATIQRNLTQFHTLRGILDDLQRSQEQVSLKNQALAVLTSELSPISGLIAEDITGFIGCVVDQLNAVISSIWEYDMTVMPCVMENGDLNYKFPIDNNDGPPRGDISQGSTGQQDVIDFAFVLTVLMYLDLGEVPLFLDELGASFDPQHRIRAMGFVKQIVDSKRFSQIFFISHYASSFSALSAGQLLVLEGTNVAVPQQHNEHVVFA